MVKTVVVLDDFAIVVERHLRITKTIFVGCAGTVWTVVAITSEIHIGSVSP